VHRGVHHADRATAVHLGVIGVGFAVGLAVCDAPSPVQTWMFVMVCVGGAAWTLHTLVARLRHLADRDQLTGLLTRGAFGTVAERVDGARPTL
jgi:hypothetical protein